MRGLIVLENQHFNDRKENLSLFACANSFLTYAMKSNYKFIN